MLFDDVVDVIILSTPQIINIFAIFELNRNKLIEISFYRRALAYSTVGTPDYIAPEVFLQTGQLSHQITFF